MKRIGMYLLTLAICGLPLSAVACTGYLDWETVINKIPNWTVVYSLPSDAGLMHAAVQSQRAVGNVPTEFLEPAQGTVIPLPVKEPGSYQNDIPAVAVVPDLTVAPVRQVQVAYRRSLKRLTHWRPLVPSAAWKQV